MRSCFFLRIGVNLPLPNVDVLLDQLDLAFDHFFLAWFPLFDVIEGILENTLQLSDSLLLLEHDIVPENSVVELQTESQEIDGVSSCDIVDVVET